MGVRGLVGPLHNSSALVDAGRGCGTKARYDKQTGAHHLQVADATTDDGSVASSSQAVQAEDLVPRCRGCICRGAYPDLGCLDQLKSAYSSFGAHRARGP